MFRAMMSQQNGMVPSNQAPTPNMLPPHPNLNILPPNFQQFSPRAVASTLAQIGVDPGYFSDSECSSNSSERTEEAAQAGQASPEDLSKKFIVRKPSNTPQYNCFNDYFGFNDMVKPPVRSAFGDFIDDTSPWKQTWKPTQSSLVKERNSSDSSSSSSSGCLSPLTEQAEYTSSTPSPTLQNIMMKKTANKRTKPQVCVFCRNNGEDESVYATHALKNAEGKVTCPILHAYECPICRATGDQAHTLKYCPRNPNGQAQQQINALAKISNSAPVTFTNNPFTASPFTPFNPPSFTSNPPSFTSNPPSFTSNPINNLSNPFPTKPPMPNSTNNNFNNFNTNNMFNNMFPGNMFPSMQQFNIPPPPPPQFNLNMPMPQAQLASTTPLPAATPDNLTPQPLPASTPSFQFDQPLPASTPSFQFDWLNTPNSSATPSASSSSSQPSLSNDIDNGLSHLLGKANLEDIFPGLLSR